MLQKRRNSAPQHTEFTAHERVSHVHASPGSRSSNRQRRSKGVWWVAVGVTLLVNLLASSVPHGIHRPGEWVSRADAFHASLQGFGASTSGGAGKPTYHVTNLNDAGPGSFRDAVSRGGRHIVFTVGGTISLKTDVWVKGAFITIDGFTAPSPRITLKNRGLLILGSSGAHDVIVRNIRVRNALGCDGCSNLGGGFLVSRDAYNVVLDHVSVQGSQNFGISVVKGAYNVTVQHSIIAENQGRVNFLSAVGGQPSSTAAYTRQVTMHRNLFIRGDDRMPQATGSNNGEVASGTQLDLRNNLVWDWLYAGSHIWKGTKANVVNNYYHNPGGSTSSQQLGIYFCRRGSKRPQCSGSDSKLYARAYIAGNISGAGSSITNYLNTLGTEGSPFAAAGVSTKGACSAAKEVLAYSGARPLDSIDKKYLSYVSLQGCSSQAVPEPLLVQAEFHNGTSADLWVQGSAEEEDPAVPKDESFVAYEPVALDYTHDTNVWQLAGEVGGESEAEENHSIAVGHGAWAVYGPIEFDAYTAFSVRVIPGQGGVLDVRLGSPTGSSLGSITVEHTRDWMNWRTYTTPIPPTTGTYMVYLTVSNPAADAGALMLVDWFTLVP